MSMLQQLMSSAMSGGSSVAKEDPTAKEGRAAWRKLMENAVKEGNQKQIAALSGNAPEGVDPSIYTTIAGLRSPAQKAQTAVDNEVAQRFLQLINGGNPVRRTPATPTPTPTKPSFVPSSTIQAPLQTTPAQTTQPSEPDSRLFTDDILFRAAIKKYTGVTVGEHYFEAPQWFAEHKELTDSGMMDSDATGQLAAKYGFIPDGASHLVSTPEEKKALFERELSANLRNPVIHDLWKQAAPEKYWNNPKQKTAWLIDKLAGFGRYVPEHYQPFLDRFRGLEDPDFVSDETLSWIWKNAGKMPSEIEPSDVAKATKQMDDHAIIQSARKIASDTVARLVAERKLEPEKPISAEDAAKHGINVKDYPTYYSLADAGRRFPTVDERKVYEQMLGAREKLLDLMPLMFGIKFDSKTLRPLLDENGKPVGNTEDGIFAGISPGWWGRTKGKASLMKDRVVGNDRGLNAEVYDKIMSDIARTLLVISKDMRFSDVDVIQMMKTQGDLGVGLFDLPDAAPTAYSLIERFLKYNGNYLDRMLKRTTIRGSEQSYATTIADAHIKEAEEAQSKGGK